MPCQASQDPGSHRCVEVKWECLLLSVQSLYDAELKLSLCTHYKHVRRMPRTLEARIASLAFGSANMEGIQGGLWPEWALGAVHGGKDCFPCVKQRATPLASAAQHRAVHARNETPPPEGLHHGNAQAPAALMVCVGVSRYLSEERQM